MSKPGHITCVEECSSTSAVHLELLNFVNEATMSFKPISSTKNRDRIVPEPEEPGSPSREIVPTRRVTRVTRALHVLLSFLWVRTRGRSDF